MLIAHFSDLHYCTKHLNIVDAAFSHAVGVALERRADLAIIAGDSFDAAIGLHEPAVNALITQIKRLAESMPVLILQGTFSHDRPGVLDVFRHVGAAFDVYVADKAERLSLSKDGKFSNHHMEFSAISICCLPSLNRADPHIIERGPAGYVKRLIDEWAFENATSTTPTILVSHGTVNGCVTESKHAMVSTDHEFNPDILFSSKCKAVMLGHIHKHQSWRHDGQAIAYPGSITRLVFGHNDPVGFLLWDISDANATFEFIPCPAPRLIDISFDGPPDMDELDTLAHSVDESDHVRIRYAIDQDHAHAIDKDGIKRLFGHVAVLKIEGTISAVQSVRAAGIGRAMTLREKLGYWAVTTGDEDRLDELEERLQLLKSLDVDDIIETFKPAKLSSTEAA